VTDASGDPGPAFRDGRAPSTDQFDADTAYAGEEQTR
jgi:hypothetical protein